ncbi:hypothetical protein QE152_g15578 [Popillia japonica]|uniref:Uncharacterized protein n=1 Tax=Popillia japonica TaxID=7064 RepID=A0AAW1L7Y2_POPJA
MDLLEFKASVARALISKGIRDNKRSRPRSATPGILKKKKAAHRAPPEIRKDLIGHWPKLPNTKNARRCHSPACYRKTKYICTRCEEP